MEGQNSVMSNGQSELWLRDALR